METKTSMALAPRNTNQQQTSPLAPDPWDEIMKPGKASGMENDDSITKLNESDRKRKMLIIIIVSVVALVFVLGIWFITKQAVDRRNAIIEQNAAAVQETPQKVETKVKPDNSSKYVNPAENDDSIGQSAKGVVKSTVKDKTISIIAEGRQSTITFPGVKDKITPAKEECQLSKAAENCYLGEGQVLGKNAGFWVFRDAKSSSLLSMDSDPAIVGSGGAALAFTHVYDENGTKKYDLFIVLKNQTGVLVSTSDAKALDSLINGANVFQVSNPD